MAKLKRNVLRAGVKFTPSVSPLIMASKVKFLPLCGRMSWFASVFNIGQGPRTIVVKSASELSKWVKHILGERATFAMITAMLVLVAIVATKDI